MSTVETLPRWNLDNLFAGPNDPKLDAARRELDGQIAALERQMNEANIRQGSIAAGDDPASIGRTLVTLLDAMNALFLQVETIGAYLHGLITTDSYDSAAAKVHSQFDQALIPLRNLEVRVKGWLGSLAPQLPAVIAAVPALAEHRFYLEFTAKQSRYLMAESEEGLAVELTLDGGSAFGRLQGTVTSQLQVPWTTDGKTELTPISRIRNLSFDPDPAVRERAYRVEIDGWHSIRNVVAACLNGVKGTAVTLAKRRGRASVLDTALDQNRIDRATLDALLGAIEEFFPVFRRYLSAKAHKLGKSVLPWWDLFAPLGAAESHFSWQAARQLIVEKFGAFSEELATFTARAFDERWIDAEPRAGKRGGAYCMPVPGVEESRILANFDSSFEQLMTLAHELGHAYHNECQRGLPMLRRGTPATLAETASIFCETLVAEAALRTCPEAERLMIVELQLANACQVCVDISSRYRFETAVFARRASGELSADDFCELMRAAQAETYGPAVDPTTYHPYMWLWKPHYYSYEENFYNFPYAFGHLFGLGLYAVYLREGAAFTARYNQLLRDTAQDYAAPLAARFGIDLHDREFWRGSLSVVAGWVERFEKL